MSITYLLRHSFKDEDGTLSEKGRKEAIEKGRQLQKQHPGKKIVAYSSNVPRAGETAGYIMQGAGTEYNEDDIEDDNLALEITKQQKENTINATGESALERALNSEPEWLGQHATQTAGFLDQYGAKEDEDTVYVGISHTPIVPGVANGAFDGDEEMVKTETPELEGLRYDPKQKLLTTTHLQRATSVGDEGVQVKVKKLYENIDHKNNTNTSGQQGYNTQST